MWYGATQIGIYEIDMDHQNIDTMLEMCLTGHVPETVLKNTIVGLIRHLKHEEEVIAEMGYDFPADHRIEHDQLAEHCLALQDDWEAEKITGKELAEALRVKLLLHVTEFDLKLKNL